MEHSLYAILWYFLIYAFLGWCRGMHGYRITKRHPNIIASYCLRVI